MKKFGLVVSVFAVFSLALACTSRVGDFTIMSSKNITSLAGAKKMGVFEGEDCKVAIAGTLPSQEEALDRACDEGGGNAMIDVVVYYKPAACIIDSNCWTVKGTVVKTADVLGESKSLDKSLSVLGPDYVREELTSPSGKKFIAFKERSAIELDHDKAHYDLVLRNE